MKSLEHVRNAGLLEGFCDAVQVEYDAMAETARSRYEALQSTEAKCQELAGQLAAMRQERDDIQLRLHAVDHAFNEQQRSPALADALRHNLELTKTLKRQREFIRTLYTSRNGKKKAKKAESPKGTPCRCTESHPIHLSTPDGVAVFCRECFGVPK